MHKETRYRRAKLSFSVGEQTERVSAGGGGLIVNVPLRANGWSEPTHQRARWIRTRDMYCNRVGAGRNRVVQRAMSCGVGFLFLQTSHQSACPPPLSGEIKFEIKYRSLFATTAIRTVNGGQVANDIDYSLDYVDTSSMYQAVKAIF